MARKDDLDALEEELARLEGELSRLGPEEEEEEEPKGRKGLSRFLPGRTKDEQPEEAEPAPEPEAPPEPRRPRGTGSWVREEGRWRRQGPGDDHPVIIRRLDEDGNVVEEHETDDPAILALVHQADEDEEDGGGFLSGIFGRREREPQEAEAVEEEEEEEEEGDRRGWILLLGLLLLGIVVAAVAWYLLGAGAAPPDVQVTTTPSDGQVPTGETISFDASGTTDPEGRTLAYAWDFGDGSATATGPSVTHTYASAGSFQVTLTITADGETVATETIPVTVLAKPTPVVDILVNGTAASGENPVVAGEPVTLSGEGTQSEVAISTYSWNVGGQSLAGPTVEHTFAEAGPHTVTLTVTTEAGVDAETSVTVLASLNTTVEGTVPQDLQAASGPPHNFTTNHGGATPARVLLVLRYTATTNPITGEEADPLNLNITDAEGNEVASVTGRNQTAVVEVSDLGGFALGTWTAVAERPGPGADRDYSLEILVAYPPTG